MHAFAAKNQLIPLLIRKLQSGEAAKYYIVLADTGMAPLLLTPANSFGPAALVRMRDRFPAGVVKPQNRIR